LMKILQIKIQIQKNIMLDNKINNQIQSIEQNLNHYEMNKCIDNDIKYSYIIYQ
jgi:hypothetical protein